MSCRLSLLRCLLEAYARNLERIGEGPYLYDAPQDIYSTREDIKIRRL